MANTEMIREYIRASGYKLQYVARAKPLCRRRSNTFVLLCKMGEN